MHEIASGRPIYGSTFTVVVGEYELAPFYTANVYRTRDNPNARTTRAYKLNLRSGSYYKKINSTQDDIPDISVSFIVGKHGKAGILKFVGKQKFKKRADVNSYLCEKID